MAIFSKYTEVQYNGNTVLFGSLTKKQQQEILDADYAQEAAALQNSSPLYTDSSAVKVYSATQTAGDSVLNNAPRLASSDPGAAKGLVVAAGSPLSTPQISPPDPTLKVYTSGPVETEDKWWDGQSTVTENADGTTVATQQVEITNDVWEQDAETAANAQTTGVEAEELSNEEFYNLTNEETNQSEDEEEIDYEQRDAQLLDDVQTDMLRDASPTDEDEADAVGPTEQDVLNSDSYKNSVAAADKSTPVEAKDPVIQYKIVSNPLHQYPTYTYGLTLYVLDKDEFNTLATDPKNWKPQNVLISSAGRYEKDMPRNANFKDDFYFEEFKMQTVIGLNSKTKASNAIDFNFSIVEPYGLTLLNRIIDASKLVNARNYLDMPYLLQIDFFGNDDAGNVMHPLPGLTKRFPIKIISMKIKVGTKGAEYALQATPFNHSAFSQTQATTPTNFAVTAGTVGAFFADGSVDTAKREAAQKTIQDEERAIAQDDNANSGGKNSKAYEEAQKVVNSPFEVASYVAGFNSYYEYLKRTGAKKTVEKIAVVFPPEIAASPIVKQDKSKVSVKPMANSAKSVEASKKDSGAAVDDTQSGFAVNNGTSILAVIDQVMANSEWLQKQVKDANEAADDVKDKNKKPMQYYKVVPQIKLENFDDASGRWNKTTTYYVENYTVYHTKYPGAPEALPPGPVKEYNYIYTGKNTDIINFDIDFNTSFYTAVTVDRANYDKTISGATKDTPDDNKDTTHTADVTGVQPLVYNYQSTNPSATIGMDSIKDSKSIKTRDVQNSIYTRPGGDMITLKLRIIGDPHFIKQDDIYTNPSNTDYREVTKGQMIESSQSLVTDKGEIFCKVTFNTPVDMDESTGLPRNDPKYSSSVFSGIYKILTVDNEFRGGKFEQTLDLVRAFGQEKAAAAADAERANADGLNSKTASSTSLTVPLLGDQEGDYPEFPGAAKVTDDDIEVPMPDTEDGPTEEELQQSVEDAVKQDQLDAELDEATAQFEQLQPIDAKTETVEISDVEWGENGVDIGDGAVITPIDTNDKWWEQNDTGGVIEDIKF